MWRPGVAFLLLRTTGLVVVEPGTFPRRAGENAIALEDAGCQTVFPDYGVSVGNYDGSNHRILTAQ